MTDKPPPYAPLRGKINEAVEQHKSGDSVPVDKLHGELDRLFPETTKETKP